MNHLSKSNSIINPAKRATLLACLLSLALTACGQSTTDHSGHDHAEETSKGEGHAAHAEHDDHADEGAHDHAEEAGHGESHETHADHDDHGDGDHVGHDHAEDEAHGESHEAHTEHDDHAGHDHEEEASPVSISPATLREFDIQLGRAARGTLHEEVILPGEIQFNRERLAFVTPRFAGTVQTINARLADTVRKGQVLATLESTETLRPFEIVAPFDGTVVAFDIAPGLTVEAGQALFTVADLTTVWADLRIYQRDLANVRQGQRVVISNGHASQSFTGTISYVAPTIDEHSRTGLARVIVENPMGGWRPGQFIKGSISIDEHVSDVVIPRTAVLTHEGQTVVFVQEADGFAPRPVELGHSDATSFEVKSGLRAGETYVTRNVISVKAEMNKGDFGGHAGHVH